MIRDLSPHQRIWLEALICNSVFIGLWCTAIEEQCIRDVLRTGCYDDYDKITLNNVMRYYKANVDKGTHAHGRININHFARINQESNWTKRSDLIKHDGNWTKLSSNYRKWS